MYECFKCPFNTPSTEAFITHREKCKEEFKLPEKCPHCSFCTGTEAALQKHIKYEHTAAAWFYCEQCPYKSLDKDCLRSHRNDQHNKKRECEECGYTSTDKEAFNKHVRNAHIMKKREFSCSLCDFRSYSEIKFDNHNKNNKHTTTSVHCEWCSYSTVDKANFRRHIFTHSPKKIDCDFCDYKNGSPYQLIKHLKKYHNGVGIEDVDLKNNVPLLEVIEDIRASIKEEMEITI